MPKSKLRVFERLTQNFLPFDHLVVMYCWVIVVLTVSFARPITDYLVIVLFHLGSIALVFLLARFAPPGRNRLLAFVRLLYPVVLMTFFYRASGLLVEVVVPRFFDGAVTGLERTLFGIDPSLWLDAHPSVFLTEVLTAFYCTYYFLIPGLAVTLLFSRRDDDIKKFMTATCATFFISYLAFIFLPVAGPRFYFADLYQHKLVGVLFRPLADFIMDNAAFRGGAMPSSHVAVAVVAAFFAVRAYGRKAWFIVPVVVGLALGTVYGRYHYAIDVVIGAIIAGVVLYATIKYYPKEKMYLPQQQVADHPSARMYVSNSI